MRVLITSLACLIAFTGFTQARLGESLDECVERYGPILDKRASDFPSSDPEVAVFSKSSIAVFVEFKKGKAWKITFRKPQLTATEVESLLKANIGDEDWGPALTIATRIFRQSGDKSRMSIISESRPGLPNALEVVSREYIEEYRASLLERAHNPQALEDAKKKNNPLPGF